MTHAMTLSPDTLATLGQTSRLPLLAVVALRIAVTVTTWSVRARTRYTLSQLDPHMLRDVGITPEQAHSESHRAFWLS